MKNKKCLIIIVIVILLGIFLINDNVDSKNIRIRVIGESNEEIDVKYKKECMKIIKSIININDTEKDVKNKMNKLKNEINNYSKKINKTIEVTYEKTKFPPKMLNDKLIEGGVYKTILVKIGEAKGNNCWALLYPEYFNFTFEDVKNGDVEIRWFLKELINNN